MAKIKDMTGLQFGNLSVVKYAGLNNRGEATWFCKCSCGNTTVVTGNKLRSGWTRSCGCLQQTQRKKGFNKRHGMTETKLYVAWQNMKRRCNNPKDIMFKHYGGRGITVCDDWNSSFDSFLQWSNQSGYKEGLTIERINVNGNYEPSNCKWITKPDQYLNRTDSHRITAFGKTQTIKEWADESGIKYDTIERRINSYGWSAEDAVSIKPHKGR